MTVGPRSPGNTRSPSLVTRKERDPEGIVVGITFTESGTFTGTENTGQTISGRFTEWFGGNFNHDGQAIVLTGTFAARGVDQDGNYIVAHGNSHVTFVNGEPVVEFDSSSASGCP